ncbi:hypothetical protein [Mycoplasma seminis]|uniref:Lmp protein n=1 Tax=Mycoplasma seminis TaxID=512749 RepID=A0ABY9H9T6_9MOLU|nr:hypothetical protein [Mycoplasma seminis]WLP85176.1 hypothetical protein Q8852_02525 [Mycoplasma seminis]
MKNKKWLILSSVCLTIIVTAGSTAFTIMNIKKQNKYNQKDYQNTINNLKELSIKFSDMKKEYSPDFLSKYEQEINDILNQIQKTITEQKLNYHQISNLEYELNSKYAEIVSKYLYYDANQKINTNKIEKLLNDINNFLQQADKTYIFQNKTKIDGIISKTNNLLKQNQLDMVLFKTYSSEFSKIKEDYINSLQKKFQSLNTDFINFTLETDEEFDNLNKAKFTTLNTLFNESKNSKIQWSTLQNNLQEIQQNFESLKAEYSNYTNQKHFKKQTEKLLNLVNEFNSSLNQEFYLQYKEEISNLQQDILQLLNTLASNINDAKEKLNNYTEKFNLLKNKYNLWLKSNQEAKNEIKQKFQGLTIEVNDFINSADAEFLVSNHDLINNIKSTLLQIDNLNNSPKQLETTLQNINKQFNELKTKYQEFQKAKEFKTKITQLLSEIDSFVLTANSKFIQENNAVINTLKTNVQALNSLNDISQPNVL